jgi:hypothetical protein
VFVTVPDPDLLAALSSETLLLATWGDAAREVMLLVQVLRTAAPALADVLALGLIVLAATPAVGAALVLQYRRAIVTVLCRRTDGSEVLSRATADLKEITRLELLQVRIAEPALAAR